MNRRNLLVLIAVVGMSAGFIAAYFDYHSSEPIPTKCEEIEQKAKQQQSFNGTLTCHPPGTIDVNISEQVEEKANLDCVCRKEYKGNVQFFPILSTGNNSS